MFTSEVEQENNFINRIKNKVKVLQMYSSAPANDIFYFGGSFDSNDYINFSKIENKDYLPLVENGAMMLPIIETKSWIPRNVTVDSLNSNGIEGNNHAVYATASEVGETYRYFFRDVQDSQRRSNIIDNNPLKYYEYEQVSIPVKSPDAVDFEFKYILNNPTNSSQQLLDWSVFTQEPLKLTLEFDSVSSSMANFVKITPYFGNANYISKDIIVKRIEVTDNKNEVQEILGGNEVYISSSFIPSSIEALRNFYYREANIKFTQREVKKFKIFLEQSDSTPVKLQHLYFSAETRSNDVDNTYSGQARFNPYSPGVPSKYPDIPWSSAIGINLSSVIPNINNPNSFKREAGDSSNVNSVDVSLSRQIPKAIGKTVVFNIPNEERKYITSNFFRNWNTGATLKGYESISPSNLNQYITETFPNTNNFNSGFIATELSSEVILNEIVSWFDNSTQDTSINKFLRFGIPQGTIISVVDIRSSDTSTQILRKKINLVRRYEQYDGFRKCIAIRDISFGYEEYAEYAQMISRKFDLSSEIEYITMSSEVQYSGNFSEINQDLVRYYVSVDDGNNWKRISPIENNFGGIPEVLAFNQNIDQTFRLPGVEYFNQPAIPSSIKGFLIKIEIFKPTGQNISPMVYSYKVGTKVRQL